MRTLIESSGYKPRRCSIGLRTSLVIVRAKTILDQSRSWQFIRKVLITTRTKSSLIVDLSFNGRWCYLSDGDIVRCELIISGDGGETNLFLFDFFRLLSLLLFLATERFCRWLSCLVGVGIGTDSLIGTGGISSLTRRGIAMIGAGFSLTSWCFRLRPRSLGERVIDGDWGVTSGHFNMLVIPSSLENASCLFNSLALAPNESPNAMVACKWG